MAGPKKRLSKKTGKRAGPSRPSKPPVLDKRKFAGLIEVTRPTSSPLSSGAHVVLTLTRLSFGALPDAGPQSEVKLDLAVRTGAADGGSTESLAGLTSGTHYYVADGSSLNVFGSVLFDGPVHRHLSLDVEVTEVEPLRMSAGDVKDLMSTSLEAVGKAAGVTGGATAVAKAVPSVVGSLIKLNGDDQVLKFATSLLTAEITPAPEPESRLRPGTYVFKKVREPGTDAAVTLELHVATA